MLREREIQRARDGLAWTLLLLQPPIWKRRSCPRKAGWGMEGEREASARAGAPDLPGGGSLTPPTAAFQQPRPPASPILARQHLELVPDRAKVSRSRPHRATLARAAPRQPRARGREATAGGSSPTPGAASATAPLPAGGAPVGFTAPAAASSTAAAPSRNPAISAPSRRPRRHAPPPRAGQSRRACKTRASEPIAARRGKKGTPLDARPIETRRGHALLFASHALPRRLYEALSHASRERPGSVGVCVCVFFASLLPANRGSAPSANCMSKRVPGWHAPRR